MVVVDGVVVVGSDGVVIDTVVVVVGGDVVVVGAVVVVAAGCVVVVAGERVVGVVVVVGNKTESGSVEIFDDLALGGTVVVGEFLGEPAVGRVVLGAAAGCVVVVVLVAGFVGANLAVRSPTVWPCTLIGWSSWCTTTNKATTARRVAVSELHCSDRR